MMPFISLIVWKQTLVLRACDGLPSAQNILLQVTDHYRKNSVEGKMGEVCIPVSSFFSEKMISGQFSYSQDFSFSFFCCFVSRNLSLIVWDDFTR
jgi:hypothetical protein